MFGGVERRGGGHFEEAAAENRGEIFSIFIIVLEIGFF